MDDGEDAVGLFFGEEGHGAAGLFKTEPEEDDEEGEDEDGADGFGIVFGLFDAAFFVAACVCIGTSVNTIANAHNKAIDFFHIFLIEILLF